MCHKTGNFKKFPVFIKMLSTALYGNTDTVFVDLLRYSDLEILKAKKTGQLTTTNSSTTIKNNKRYLILTYAVEFDRVHYPLPLKYEEEISSKSLKQTIARLRSEIYHLKIKKESTSTISNNQQSYHHIKQENIKLKQIIKHLQERKHDENLVAEHNDIIDAMEEEINILNDKIDQYEIKLKAGGYIDGKQANRKQKDLERRIKQATELLNKEKRLHLKLLTTKQREYQRLSKKYDKLLSNYTLIKKSSDSLSVENKQIKKELKNYKLDLKKAKANYSKLERNYNKVKGTTSRATSRATNGVRSRATNSRTGSRATNSRLDSRASNVRSRINSRANSRVMIVTTSSSRSNSRNRLRLTSSSRTNSRTNLRRPISRLRSSNNIRSNTPTYYSSSRNQKKKKRFIKTTFSYTKLFIKK